MPARGKCGKQTNGRGISGKTPYGGRGSLNFGQLHNLNNISPNGIGRGVSDGGRGSFSMDQPHNSDNTSPGGIGRGVSGGGRGSFSMDQPHNSNNTSPGIGRGVSGGGRGSLSIGQPHNSNNTPPGGMGIGVSGGRGSLSIGQPHNLDNTSPGGRRRGVSGGSGRCVFGGRGSLSLDQPHNNSDDISPDGDSSVHEGSQPLTSNSQQRKKRGITMGVKPPKQGEEKILVQVLTRTLSPIQARTKIGPLFRKCFKKCRTKFSDWRKCLDFGLGRVSEIL